MPYSGAGLFRPWVTKELMLPNPNPKPGFEWFPATAVHVHMPEVLD